MIRRENHVIIRTGVMLLQVMHQKAKRDLIVSRRTAVLGKARIDVVIANDHLFAAR